MSQEGHSRKHPVGTQSDLNWSAEDFLDLVLQDVVLTDTRAGSM